MKKRLFSCICLIVISIILPSSAFAYHIVGLDNFEKKMVYSDDIFYDVATSSWYRDNVASAYEYGLMNGNGNGTFAPLGNISIAEAITAASRLYGIYHYSSTPLFEDVDGLWYEPYVNYAQESGITQSNYASYTVPATRAEFAKILAASIDPVDFQEINYIDDGAIPDVDMDSDYADAVYMLYRAGILTGSDSSGAYKPDSTITRAEAAALITRIVDPGLRKSIELIGEY